MQITRTSIVSGITRTRDLDITQDQIDAHRAGMVIQRAFPDLSADDREFYLTGIIQDEWDDTFKEDCEHDWHPGVDEAGNLVEPAYDVCINCGERRD